MKLATQIFILIVAGLAIHGISRNGMEPGLRTENRCDCCGKPRPESSRTVITGEPARGSNASFEEAYQASGPSPDVFEVPRLPKPEAGGESPSAVAMNAVDPMVQDILEIRRRMGGSSIASILEGEPGSTESGFSNAIDFQQAVREYAEKANYEQADEKPELHCSANQGPRAPGTGQTIPDFVRWLGRFRF